MKKVFVALLLALSLSNVQTKTANYDSLGALCVALMFHLLPEEYRIPVAFTVGSTASVVCLAKGAYDLKKLKNREKEPGADKIFETEIIAKKDRAKGLLFLGAIMAPVSGVLGWAMLYDYYLRMKKNKQ